LPVSKAQRLDSISDRQWKSISFSQATAMLNESGAFANGDETGLTAEFPFDHGAISAGDVLNEGFSKRTSLLQIQREEHPNLGEGLLCRLELPLLVEDSEARRLAMSLNRMEATTDDWPPFLGAWTSRPKSGRPTFVSFWSDSFANKIGVETIARWMADRARRIPVPLGGNAGLMPDTDDAMIYIVALGVTLTGRSTISSLYRKSLQSMAAERGVQPRKVQSGMWHAACALFPESYKTPNNRATIDQIWQKAADGQITFDQAREEIFEFAGGFKKAAAAEPSSEG
jgi:hypothetical protein